MSDMICHIDRMGIHCVTLGSDFDDATILAEIGDTAGLKKARRCPFLCRIRQDGPEEDLSRKLADGSAFSLARNSCLNK